MIAIQTSTNFSFILVVMIVVRLHFLDNFHCEHPPSLQIVQPAKGRGGWPPASSRSARRRPTARCGYCRTRRETASLPTGYTSGTAASISGTTACPDGNASAGLRSTAGTRTNSQITAITLPAAEICHLVPVLLQLSNQTQY